MNIKMIKKYNVLFYIIILLIDVLIVYLSIKFAYWIRFEILSSSDVYIKSSSHWRNYYQFFNTYVIIYFIVLYHFGFYKKDVFISKYSIKNNILASGIFIISIFFISFYLQYFEISRIFYVLFFSLLVFCNIIRFFVKIIILNLFAKYGFIKKNLIFICINSSKMKKIIEYYKKNNLYDILGYLDYNENNETELTYLGKPEDFKSSIHSYSFDNLSVIIAPNYEYKDLFFQIINYSLANNIDIFILQDLLKLKPKYIKISEIENIPLLKIN